MLIHELAQQTGVPAKKIRYYEGIGLLPPPARQANNYRQYSEAAVERLRFIASARSFGFSLADIATILAIRDAGLAPCDHVLATLQARLADIDRLIADMLALRDTLRHLYETGATLPRDDVAFEHCVCSLIKSYPKPSHASHRTVRKVHPRHASARQHGDSSRAAHHPRYLAARLDRPAPCFA